MPHPEVAFLGIDCFRLKKKRREKRAHNGRKRGREEDRKTREDRNRTEENRQTDVTPPLLPPMHTSPDGNAGFWKQLQTSRIHSQPSHTAGKIE